MKIKRKMWWILTVAGILVCVVVGFRISGAREKQRTKPWITCSRLFYLASVGCGEFNKQHGKWPSSLAELCASRPDLNRTDAWGRDFVFKPYDKAVGYGEIVSYGRDGKPGGSGLDRDLVVRFPVKENADWNKQQAASVELPPQLKSWTNWYDQYE